MKTLLSVLVSLLFIGCAAPEGDKIKMRCTFYAAKEDRRWGNKIAISSSRRAIKGITAAIDPKVIPYNSIVSIPALSGKIDKDSFFRLEDTGSAVKSRKASGGKEPIIDIYVNSIKEVRYFAANTPKYVDTYIIKK